MAKIEAGQKFGMLTAVEFVEWTPGRHVRWRFKCDCGNNDFVALVHNVRDPRHRSCGCHRKAVLAVGNLKHGKWKTPEFKVWGSMFDRCTNPTNKNYHLWGGAGVTICERWRHSFENFLADMGTRPSPEHSIDRYPNPFGNYEPDNCRWATAKEQQRNRRNNRIVEFNGRQMTFAEACEITGLAYSTLNNRLKRGWTIDRALNTLPNTRAT